MDHFATLVYEPDDSRGNNLKGETDDWYLTIKLESFTFLKRVRVAINYILGREKRYGQYTEICLNTEDVIDIYRWLSSKLFSNRT